MGDIEHHLAVFSEPAADLFIQRHEEPMHLEAHRARTGLAFAGAGGIFTQVGQILAADAFGGYMPFELLGCSNRRRRF